MAGWYQDADKYPLSSWVLGCLEREIDAHVKEERNRIIKQLKSKRCECLTLSGYDLMALIKKDERLSHQSCEWTFLSAVMELIEETK